MLIDVSMNRNSAQCHVIKQLDNNTSTLGLPMMKYYTTANHDEVVELLYPGGLLDFSATVLCSNNESVDRWNLVAQTMNPSQIHTIKSKNIFSEVDDPKSHLKKCSHQQCLKDLKRLEYLITSFI